jgi:hypothetical protein
MVGILLIDSAKKIGFGGKNPQLKAGFSRQIIVRRNDMSIDVASDFGDEIVIM